VPKVVINRLLISVPTLFLVTFIDFMLSHLLPGNPALAIAGPTASPAQIAAVDAQLHLNDPLVVQYWKWLVDSIHGNFGMSFVYHESVASLISSRYQVTLSLALYAMILTAVLGVGAGLLAAVRGGLLDNVITAIAGFFLAVPQFFLGLLLVFFFAVKLPFFAGDGYTSLGTSFTGFLKTMTLPSLTLALTGAAVVARQFRSELVGVFQKEYIGFAEAKGLSSRIVLFRHAFRNAFGPALTLLGLQVAGILGGAIIIEEIFNLPGLGGLMILSLQNKDIPVLQALVLIACVIVLLANLLTDIGYARLNPRVRAK